MLTVERLRIWAFVHKWTSLICTLFLLVLCLTGLPLVFRDEIALWLGTSVQAPHLMDNVPPVNVDRIVEAAQARRGGEYVRAVARDEEEPLWHVFMGLTPRAPENTAVLTFDARTAKLLHESTLHQEIMHVLLKLHVELFAGLPGTLFLGCVGLLFLCSVISGIVVYGPFMRKLPFGTVRRERDWRLRWLDLHNLLGIVTVLWVLSWEQPE